MKPGDFILKYQSDWSAATHHEFLDAASNSSLDPHVFAVWLVQDYLFVKSEISCIARLLARAPRISQRILIQALDALEAEATWFEEHAQNRQLSLDVEPFAGTRAYQDFFQSLEQESFPVALTGIWAVERAYLDAWNNAAPGHETYRPYIEHWANPVFAQFVTDLEAVVTKIYDSSTSEEALEKTFLKVAKLEKGFWDMAWKGQ